MRRFFLVFVTMSIFSGLIYGQNGKSYLLENMPESWVDDELFEQTLPCEDLWWQKFNDPLLDSLIIVATERNFSVLGAIKNIGIAKESWHIAQGKMLPSVDLGTGWTRQKASGNLSQMGDTESWYGYYNAAMSMSWQVDVFGSIYKRAQAEKRMFQATEEEYKAVIVSLCAQVATAYISLRQYQTEVQVLKENTLSQKEILKITEVRHETGLASRLDVAQAKSVYFSTLASIPATEAMIIEYKNSLGILLGMYPENINNCLENPKPLPGYVELVGVGVPANLLRRRPDVRKAEKVVESKASLLGASRRDWLPAVYLNGSIGYSANETKELLKSKSLVWEIAPAIKWNLFSDGQLFNSNGTTQAKYELEASIISFNSTILNAVQEVENAMAKYKNSVLQIVALRETVNQGKETLNLSLELYKQGLTTFQNVLDAQRSLLTYQGNLVQSRGATILALIQLYEALGGGW